MSDDANGEDDSGRALLTGINAARAAVSPPAITSSDSYPVS